MPKTLRTLAGWREETGFEEDSIPPLEEKAKITENRQSCQEEKAREGKEFQLVLGTSAPPTTES